MLAMYLFIGNWPWLGIGVWCNGCPPRSCGDDEAVIHGYCCGCARPLGSKEIDASQAERLGRSCLSIVPRSRSHARLRQNATMSHAFSCVQPAFIHL
ncbi:hypothetical protein EVAR_6122_1 [Eumeta japonica]|uniref:Secreted protein n=1 Tax=Eumeta variegata TaxID=151549 RepID=A0A4C1TH84_EUMVA|nr:hypothetical protein EVAR_6122_1 [Eumeta japonica]